MKKRNKDPLIIDEVVESNVLEKIDGSTFEGIRSFLKEVEQKHRNYTEFYFSFDDFNEYEISVDIRGSRPETEEEIKERLNTLRISLEEKEKTKQYRKEQEYKEYLRLKKKFEKNKNPK